ncbi:WecB/TagA/CpsF family glycosyltransferase [Nocardioidaceae bacterium]|nr:WecB/TagA/CpsF family glycosyltransferase [Nocardioidaceae bacterium]
MTNSESVVFPAVTVPFGGLKVSLTNLQECQTAFNDLNLIRRSPPQLVVTPNIAHFHQARRSPDLRAAYARADLATPDGWPVVLAMQLLHRDRCARRAVSRTTGADMIYRLPRGARVLVVGGKKDAAHLAARHLSMAIGVEALPSEPAPREELVDRQRVAALCERVADARPDFIIVGLGVPQQERFALRLLPAIEHGVVLLVGASVEFAAGYDRRAPKIFRHLGLEWLFRLVRAPRRLVGRYARSAPYFLLLVFRGLIRGSG